MVRIEKGTMNFKTEKQAFINVLAQEIGTTPEKVKQFAFDLIRRATIVQKHAIDLCNRPVTEKEKADAEVAERAIKYACQDYGIIPQLDGDPRGYVVKLVLPKTRRSNNLGGDAWGVPTRV